MNLISSLPDAPLDIVGDVHGEADALAALLHHLGYDVRGRHPGGRRLVFVGDLCDRGPDSPAVIAFVRRVVEDGFGCAVVGNHELNLLRGDRKEGNDWFWAEGSERDAKFLPSAAASATERQDILAFLGALPLALEREDLRVVHAAWHGPSLQRIRQAPPGASLRALDLGWEAETDAVLGEPGFVRRREAERGEWGGRFQDPAAAMPMLDAVGLADERRQIGNPLRVLSSGIERLTPRPFFSGGRWRFVERVRWWDAYEDSVPVVFGHYWRRLVPVDRRLFGKGGPDLFEGVDPLAWHGARGNTFCVDYSAGGRFAERAAGPGRVRATRLAALRWPERTIVCDTGETLDTRRDVTGA